MQGDLQQELERRIIVVRELSQRLPVWHPNVQFSAGANEGLEEVAIENTFLGALVPQPAVATTQRQHYGRRVAG